MKKITNWPDLPQTNGKNSKFIIELKKALYQAKLDIHKAQLQAEIEIDKAKKLAEMEAEAAEKLNASERTKAAYANEYVQAQAVNNAYLDIAKQQVEAPGAKAEFVQKAATAISAAYIAVVGLSFGIGEHNTILPFSGILPTIFLGISIFLATAYTGFISDPGTTKSKPSKGTLPSLQFERRNTFIRWTQSAALGRRRLLHTSIVSLGISICYLPAPYLQIDNTLFVMLVAIGMLCLMVVPKMFGNKTKQEKQEQDSDVVEQK